MARTPTQIELDGAITRLIADSQLLHDVVNGTATATVNIGGEQIKTLRNAIASIVDNAVKLDNDFSNIKSALNDPLRLLGLDGILKSGRLEFVSGSIDNLVKNGNYFVSHLATGIPTWTGNRESILLVFSVDRGNNSISSVQLSISWLSDPITAAQIFIRRKANPVVSWSSWFEIGGGSSSSSSSSSGLGTLLTDRGDLATRSGSSPSRLPIGNANTFLASDGTDPEWRPQSDLTGSRVSALPKTPNGTGLSNAGAFIMDDGAAIVWGGLSGNGNGLGVPTSFNNSVRVPTPMAFPQGAGKVVKLAFGYSFGFAIMDNGDVYSWGSNVSGVLGQGNLSSFQNPKKIAGLSSVNVVDVAVSQHYGLGAPAYAHALFLTDTGAIYASGSNSHRQVGDGGANNVLTPVLISGTDVYTAIFATQFNSYAIRGQRLYSWGRGGVNMLGRNTASNTLTPTLVSAGIGTNHVTGFACSYDDSLAAGDQANGFCMILLGTIGQVWAFGNNSSGQLGDGTNTARATPVRSTIATEDGIPQKIAVNGGTGASYIAVNESGALACGENHHGNLSQGNNTDRNTFATMRNSERIVAGSGVLVRQIQPLGSGGYEGVALLYEDGTILACGANGVGQLGVGDALDKNELQPVLGLAHEKPIQLCAVGTGSQASLGVLTESGRYYQTGFVGNNRQFPGYPSSSTGALRSFQRVRF